MTSSRQQWPEDFSPVFTHCGWQQGAFPLAQHPDYFLAKTKADPHAAERVCYDIVREDVLDEIFDYCSFVDADLIRVVAPTAGAYNSSNALSRTYAKYISDACSWKLDSLIFQYPSVKRDFKKDRWFRLVNEASFLGEVERGGFYVIADDVLTTGGTIAALKGFIELGGGTVICMTTLASADGDHVRIAVSDDALGKLRDLVDGAVCQRIEEEFGYAIECLTEPEARFLIRECTSADAFDAGVLQGKNGGA